MRTRVIPDAPMDATRAAQRKRDAQIKAIKLLARTSKEHHAVATLVAFAEAAGWSAKELRAIYVQLPATMTDPGPDAPPDHPRRVDLKTILSVLDGAIWRMDPAYVGEDSSGDESASSAPSALPESFCVR